MSLHVWHCRCGRWFTLRRDAWDSAGHRMDACPGCRPDIPRPEWRPL
jgi:hypothetical protein